METPATHSKTIDEYSFAARPALFCNANTPAAIGTVFFWQTDERTYLITNWHNVTGINPSTSEAMGAKRPTRLEVAFFNANKRADFALKSFRLYDSEGRPKWLIHKEYGEKVDIVACPLQVPDGYNCHPINRLSSADLKVRVGHDLFILGFPFSKSLFDWGGLPVWKRGSLASEPDWVLASELYHLVDTASRPGMSGSPVIRRAYGGAEMSDGTMKLGRGGTYFFGVYAGRVTTKDPHDAQLGRVYGRSLLDDILRDGVRDSKTTKPDEPEHTEELVSVNSLSGAPLIKL